MSRIQLSDPIALWRAIEQAGGVQAYVDAQLTERGFVVQRRETDKMSDRERDAYKKSLKAEAEERRRLSREAWDAHKATHIVHLGEGVFWTEGRGHDKWDLPNAEARAAENELPPLDSAKQLAEALGLTIAELRRLAYHRDAATVLNYRRFTIPKRDGSSRAIWAPMPRLKKAQRWILHNIVEKLLVHGSVHGFLPGRSTLTNAAAHADPKLVVKVDIKDFFPTVTLPQGQGRLPQGRLSRGGRHAAGADLHRVAPRDRRAGGEDLLRRARPALPAPGCADESGPDQHAGPPPRPPAQRAGEEAGLALYPICRRPDLQPPARTIRARRASARCWARSVGSSRTRGSRSTRTRRRSPAAAAGRRSPAWSSTATSRRVRPASSAASSAPPSTTGPRGSPPRTARASRR